MVQESLEGARLREDITRMSQAYDTGEGRTLDELKRSKGILKGQEAQRLRSFCTTNCMDVRTDLDDDGQTLIEGELAHVRLWWSTSVMMTRGYKEICEEDARKEVAQRFAKLHWGPIQTPLFSALLIFMQLVPDRRAEYLAIARFLMNEAKVPVDTRDLSGTTALGYSLSTKPMFDLEYAQMLVDAGGDVNSRNRYGNTVARAILQIYDQRNPAVVRRAREALQFFFANGGNLDIADGNGATARSMLQKSVPIAMLHDVVKKEDERRAAKAAQGVRICTTCGREESPTLRISTCSGCKKAMYCDPKVRKCQKYDWPRHKKAGCGASA